MTDAGRLRIVRGLHTAIYIVMSVACFAVLYAGISGRSGPWLYVALTLGERSLNEPLGGWKGELLGPRLVGPPIHVTTDQRDGDGAVWLDMEHDGWNEAFGLNHQRRLYLDQRMDELRAEEKLFPTPGRKEMIRQIAAQIGRAHV